MGQELSHVSEVLSLRKRPGQHGAYHLFFNCKYDPYSQNTVSCLSLPECEVVLNSRHYKVLISQFYSCRFSPREFLYLSESSGCGLGMLSPDTVFARAQ